MLKPLIDGFVCVYESSVPVALRQSVAWRKILHETSCIGCIGFIRVGSHLVRPTNTVTRDPRMVVIKSEAENFDSH